MKKIEKQRKNSIFIGKVERSGKKGITLVALVVTIVVLLILVGITLTYALGDNSIFNKVIETKDQTAIAKAREKLELVLTDAKVEKYTEPKYNQNEYLDEMILSKVKNSKVKGDIVISDGYAFTLDRSIPWIEEYIGREEELIFPLVTVSPFVLASDYRTATFTVTASEESKGINRIEIWIEGERIDAFTKRYDNIKTEITESYTVNRNGVYTIKVYADLAGSTTTKVEGIVPTVEFVPNGDKRYIKEHTTKVVVKETNEKIKSMKYKWTISGANPPEENEFTQICTNNSMITGEDNDMTGTYYLWILLETETGKTSICGSEGFNFDNEGPSISEINAEWVEDEKEGLNIKVSGVIDEYSGVGEEVEVFITKENGELIKDKININDTNNSITVYDIDKTSLTLIEITAWDMAGNKTIVSRKVGRIPIIDNGKLVHGEIVQTGQNNTRVWEDSANQYICFWIRSYGGWSSFARSSGYRINWNISSCI